MDERLKISVFNSCFKPVKIYNDGNPMYVPCGHCPACLNKRSKRLTSRVLDEFKSNKYACFFTLTYDNKHVPLVRWHDDVQRWIPDYVKPTLALNCDGSSLDRPFYPQNLMLPAHFDRNTYVPPINNMPADDIFACVNKQDVIKFVKRLRRNLNTMLSRSVDELYRCKLVTLLDSFGFDSSLKFTSYRLSVLLKNDQFKTKYYELKKEKTTQKRSWKSSLVRYFIAAEYGPKQPKGKVSHHRPHYHGILFTSSEEVYSYLPCAIRKSWKMCNKSNIDIQPVTDERVSGYVSKYVNGNTDLPEILRSKLTNTFYLSSRTADWCSLFYSPEKILDMYQRGTFTESVQRYEKDGSCTFVDVPVPSFVLSRYFPKAKGFSTLSPRNKLQIYSRFYAPTVRDKEVTKQIYSDYRLYQKSQYNPYSGKTQKSIPADFFAADIAAARACAKWCDYFKCTPESYLEVLDWYYYKLEQYKLQQQYLLAAEHPNVCYDLSLFDDLPVSLDEMQFYDVESLKGISPPVMELRFSLIGAALEEFYGIDVADLYDDAGYLDEQLVDMLKEHSYNYYNEYINDILDDIKKSNKSKVLNDEVLNSVY